MYIHDESIIQSFAAKHGAFLRIDATDSISLVGSAPNRRLLSYHRGGLGPATLTGVCFECEADCKAAIASDAKFEADFDAILKRPSPITQSSAPLLPEPPSKNSGLRIH